MSRLIDVDKLIEDIYSNAYACTNDEINKILHKQLETNINVINNQPTAFDVDKVVKQLECEEGTVCGHKLINKNCFGCEGCDDCKMEDAYRYAIEIVKVGGINERNI